MTSTKTTPSDGTAVKYLSGQYYQVPNNLHRAVKSPYSFAVLCKLMQHADRNGYCFPSQETLAQGFMSTKQVARATVELTKSGLIAIERTWIRGGGVRLEYTVNLSRLSELVQQTHSPIYKRPTVQSPAD